MSRRCRRNISGTLIRTNTASARRRSATRRTVSRTRRRYRYTWPSTVLVRMRTEKKENRNGTHTPPVGARKARRYHARPGGIPQPRRSGPRHQPRLVPARLGPALGVREDFHALEQPGQLPVRQEEARRGVRMLLQVAQGGLGEDEQSPGREHPGKRGEQGPPEIVQAEHDVEGPRGQRLFFHVQAQRPERQSRLASGRGAPPRGTIRDTPRVDVRAAPREPERVLSRPPRHVEGPARARQPFLQRAQESGRLLDAAVRPLAIPQVPPLPVRLGHGAPRTANRRAWSACHPTAR